MRPVEELQRDVLHLLLVDHAEVQAVVHVVLAQGPAPHARRHLAPFPSPQRTSGSPWRGAARPEPARPPAPPPAEATPLRREAPRPPRRGAELAEGRSSSRRAHASGGGEREGRRSYTTPLRASGGKDSFLPDPPPPLPNGLTRVGTGRHVGWAARGSGVRGR